MSLFPQGNLIINLLTCALHVSRRATNAPHTQTHTHNSPKRPSRGHVSRLAAPASHPLPSPPLIARPRSPSTSRGTIPTAKPARTRLTPLHRRRTNPIIKRIPRTRQTNSAGQAILIKAPVTRLTHAAPGSAKPPARRALRTHVTRRLRHSALLIAPSADAARHTLTTTTPLTIRPPRTHDTLVLRPRRLHHAARAPRARHTRRRGARGRHVAPRAHRTRHTPQRALHILIITLCTQCTTVHRLRTRLYTKSTQRTWHTFSQSACTSERGIGATGTGDAAGAGRGGLVETGAAGAAGIGGGA